MKRDIRPQLPAGRLVLLLVLVFFLFISTESELAAIDRDLRTTEGSSAEARSVNTKHQISIGGKILKYTAHAGFLPIRDQFNEIKALFFYVAYTLDDVDSGRPRPVTFAWNGGPGAASSLVHLGFLGPRRAKSISEYETPPPPYELVDNAETWLRFTDLVMVDPIGTGYSYALKPEFADLFLGVSQDIDSVTEFIRIYLNHYDVQDAPVFLLGESYGAFRAAGVAEELVNRGISLNGVFMIGSVLDMRTSSDLSLALLIPSYTAAAFYHNQLSPDLQGDLKSTLRQAEIWAETEYVGALMRGDRLSGEERQAATENLARFTGLSREVIDDNNLRIEMNEFAGQLMASEGKFVGHYDSRILGESGDASGSYDPNNDPSLRSNGISALFVPYVRSELGFKTDRPYQGPFGGFWPPSSSPRGDWMAYRWDWGSILDDKLDMSAALARAMRKNSGLRVFMVSGYYDLATPYSITENTISRMGLGPELRKNIVHEVYPGGHAIYLDNDNRLRLAKDAAAFYEGNLGADEARQSVKEGSYGE